MKPDLARKLEQFLEPRCNLKNEFLNVHKFIQKAIESKKKSDCWELHPETKRFPGKRFFIQNHWDKSILVAKKKQSELNQKARNYVRSEG